MSVDIWGKFPELVLYSGPFAQIFEADGRVEWDSSDLHAFLPYGPPRRGAIWEVGGATLRGEAMYLGPFWIYAKEGAQYLSLRDGIL